MMGELYIGGAILTAVYLLHFTPGQKPQGGEWLAYAAMVALWPLVFLWALYFFIATVRER